jgi:hypothetical protein
MAEYTVTRTLVRPSVDVEFFEMPTSLLEYVGQTYRSGSVTLLGTVRIMTPDRLTLTFTNTWASKEAFDAFKADPVIATYFTNLNAYCDANGIGHFGQLPA